MRVLSLVTSMVGTGLLVLLGTALLAASLLALTPARSADHADAPGVAGDRAADIADLFAFRSPGNSDNLVVALTVNPLTAPPENAASNFATDVLYDIHVDNTGDLVADATVTVSFSGDPLRFTISGLGAPISGLVTPPSAGGSEPVITETGGIKAFAGQRDDPFFFDLVGFTNFVASPQVPAQGLRPVGQTPADTLAGTNVSAIVIELPIVALTGEPTSSSGVIRAWATTSRGDSQLDRMAIPAINTALIPGDMKDAFNRADPANDAADFRAAGQATIEALRGALLPLFGPEDGGPLGDLTAEQVAGALIPDVVTIDFSQPVGFPNGRTLTDDVIDAALGIVLNRGGAAGVSDAIDGNDMAFPTSFPYLAPQHTSASPTPPSSGNAGLAATSQGAAGWTVLLGGIGTALLVLGGGLTMRRMLGGPSAR